MKSDSLRLVALAAVVSCLPPVISTASGADEPVRVNIWDGASAEDDLQVFATVHSPDKPNGTAIIICPGGGYGGRVSGPEGHQIAQWLNRHGVTGVVLDYRLPRGNYRLPLADVQRALRYIRQHADKWNLRDDRIGVMGFSAGGHLASSAGTHFSAGVATAEDPVERQSCRPDFLVLVYPVISMTEIGHSGSRKNLLGANPSAELLKKFSNELQVTPQTPPTFLAHAVDDKPVPIENSRRFYLALQKHQVKARLMELPNGGHGLNGYRGESWDAWQRESIAWLKALWKE